jgi:hypothetical protein
MLLSFLEERDIPRRGREARDWLTTDERGRVIGLIIASVAISILMSLLATALVGFVERRRTAPADAVETVVAVVPEPEGVNVPVMEAAAVQAEPTPA